MPLPRRLRRPTFEIPDSWAGRDASELVYALSPERLRPGHRLELLVDGARTFAAMLEAIGSAREYVHLETYILEDDHVGQLFARALADRARAGVEVRLMFDSFGSLTLPEQFVAQLRESGVEVVEFRPLRLMRMRKHWSRRDHRKILVVDGVVGFTGGINLSIDYAPHDFPGKGWRDTHVRVTGPAVVELEAIFRSGWYATGGPPYAPRPRAAEEAVATPDTALACAIASDEGRRAVIRRHYLRAIEQARDHIYIANAYFVPDRGLLRALKRAARRGVRTEIIIPSESDVYLVQKATEHLIAGLLRAGVHVHQWPETHMHAKTAVVDGVWSVVGSYNLDSISLLQNYEVVLEVVDRRFGAIMAAQFDRDRERCARLTSEAWSRRPWWRRWVESLAYQLRRWL